MKVRGVRRQKAKVQWTFAPPNAQAMGEPEHCKGSSGRSPRRTGRPGMVCPGFPSKAGSRSEGRQAPGFDARHPWRAPCGSLRRGPISLPPKLSSEPGMGSAESTACGAEDAKTLRMQKSNSCNAVLSLRFLRLSIAVPATAPALLSVAAPGATLPPPSLESYLPASDRQGRWKCKRIVGNNPCPAVARRDSTSATAPALF